MTDGQSTHDIDRFSHAGLSCKVVQTDIGHWCGYVRIPESLGPVRWTSDYDSKHDKVLEADVDVWGGITYGPDDDGWVGFDDAHASSLINHREQNSDKSSVKEETQRLAEQIVQLDMGTDRSGGDG
jgi:hypothetical protein